jgi:hypothetical protein
MALHQSPKMVTDGLVFCYDMPNGKSFVGGPVTNTLPNPSVNGLPTFGNGWGTYNTNQYNGNTYFSIGSISSVSSNIITTSGNHPLRSYDVVTPQTSGGGLSAGTNYLVKKLSNTTFSLHPYNGSQDGSQGYINPATGNHKVYDDFANDIRVSVNASSFPTMWWGPPHLPNSALVKEIIPNGFNGIVGRMPTDCIRLHFNRTDTTDGMAYGSDAAVTAGVQHTVSFWTRSVTSSAVGQYLSYQIYNYGATTPTGYSFNAVLGPVGEWTKQQMTFTPNNPLAISYWFPSTGSFKCDVSNIQFEVGTVANNFAPGTRSNTQSIVDLTNNNPITATSLTYASNGSFSFNGSSNYMSLSGDVVFKTTGGHTVENWFKLDSVVSGNLYNFIGASSIDYHSWYWTVYQSRLAVWDKVLGGWYYGGTVIQPNVWYQAAMVTNDAGTSIQFYLNGINDGGTVANASFAASGSGLKIGFLGRGDAPNGRYMHGLMPITKVYNRALTATEIQQNFNALRNRYGI